MSIQFHSTQSCRWVGKQASQLEWAYQTHSQFLLAGIFDKSHSTMCYFYIVFLKYHYWCPVPGYIGLKHLHSAISKDADEYALSM